VGKKPGQKENKGLKSSRGARTRTSLNIFSNQFKDDETVDIAKKRKKQVQSQLLKESIKDTDYSN